MIDGIYDSLARRIYKQIYQNNFDFEKLKEQQYNSVEFFRAKHGAMGDKTRDQKCVNGFGASENKDPEFLELKS